MTRLALLLVLAIPAACGPTVIVMKNPKTGELMQCRGSTGGATMGADALAAAQLRGGVSSCRVGSDDLTISPAC
jgi:hypothetical protein